METFQTLSSPEFQKTTILISIFASVIAILYFVILEQKNKQSIGKMLMNIYVESGQKERRVWQQFVRSMFLIPTFPFILLWILDPLFLLFTKDKRRLSEILSKTRVVEEFNLV